MSMNDTCIEPTPSALITDLLETAEADLTTAEGLRDAINEAQASGGINGQMMADILMGLPETRWSALCRMADEMLAAAAINRMYVSPGKPGAEYADADLDCTDVEKAVTKAQTERVASALAGLFGAVGVAQ